MEGVPHPIGLGQQPERPPRPRFIIDTTSPAAVERWVAEVRALMGEVKPLVWDALAPKGERIRSRRFLRRMLHVRFRKLEEHVAAIEPPADTREAAPTPPEEAAAA